MADQVVVWSPEALQDVDEIAAYIARDSAFYAAAVVEKLLVAASKPNQFPQSGSLMRLNSAERKILIGEKGNASLNHETLS